MPVSPISSRSSVATYLGPCRSAPLARGEEEEEDEKDFSGDDCKKFEACILKSDAGRLLSRHSHPDDFVSRDSLHPDAHAQSPTSLSPTSSSPPLSAIHWSSINGVDCEKMTISATASRFSRPILNYSHSSRLPSSTRPLELPDSSSGSVTYVSRQAVTAVCSPQVIGNRRRRAGWFSTASSLVSGPKDLVQDQISPGVISSCSIGFSPEENVNHTVHISQTQDGSAIVAKDGETMGQNLDMQSLAIIKQPSGPTRPLSNGLSFRRHLFFDSTLTAMKQVRKIYTMTLMLNTLCLDI
ncbi:unnamed protein product [Protopolystoma xenopodis]|uniref:Uncharacterized protein n=1 Tax=Protopolystoma xenopodis TaxID=117903 RepID=A0A3S5CJD8_9PLAT|nr:unnamed protein product [Protopolystoma xenopodis]